MNDKTPAEREAEVRECCRTLAGEPESGCQFRDALLAMLDMNWRDVHDLRDDAIAAVHAVICPEEE